MLPIMYRRKYLLPCLFSHGNASIHHVVLESPVYLSFSLKAPSLP